jgi:transposase InsO family protein
VEAVRRRLGVDRVSERRACRALGQPRSTQRYRLKKIDADRRLIAEMRRLVESFPRYGSERVHQLLVETGWRVNFKRVHRLWKQERMQVTQKQRKRRRLPDTSANGCVRHQATHANHVWSYDFVADRTEDGRQLKLLVVIDEFTRECLAIEAGRSFTARDVRLTLQYLFAVRGAPEHIRSDNGPEFVAKNIKRWLDQAQVRTLYIQKASPWENGYVESFNGKLRDELLNRELFLGLDEDRYVLDTWRNDYNHRRPHSGIGWQTPAAYAARLTDPDGAFPSALHADPPVGATPLPPVQHACSIDPILSD